MSQFSTKFLPFSFKNVIILRQFAYRLRQNLTSLIREDIRALENIAIARLVAENRGHRGIKDNGHRHTTNS